MAALAAMLIAAIWSAQPEKPHLTHLKVSLFGLFPLSLCPHAGQIWEVPLGLTSTTGTPARAALYSMKLLNCLNA